MARLDLTTIVRVKGANTLMRLNQNLVDTNTQMTKTQKALSIGLGALGGALVGGKVLDFLGDAAKLASGLEEAQNKVNVVFGEGADEVEQWSKTSAESFGTSQRAALEAAGTYGNLFRAFGLGQGKAQEMSTTLVELAADMASFNNTSIDDALEALRSGLSGETEPLKRFGVALTDARLREIAMAEGIYDGVGALNAAQKAQAAYTLILEDTALAQGDFARTADGLANSQRRIDAGMENIVTEIGKGVASIQLGAIKLLDTFADLDIGLPGHFEHLRDELEPLMKKTGLDFEELRDKIQDITEETGQDFETSAKLFEAAYTIEIPKSAQEGIKAMGEELRRGGPVIADAWDRNKAVQQNELDKMIDAAHAAGIDSVTEFAAGAISAGNEVTAAWEQLQDAQENVLTRTAEIAKLQGQLASSELAAGLNDHRPEVRLAAQALRATIVDRLQTLNAYQWGLNVSGTLAAGMLNNLWRVRAASVAVASATGAQFRIESEPPDHSSPLYGITKWGGNIVKTLAEGMMRELGSASGASTALAGSLLGGPLAGVSPTGMGGSVYHTHIHLTYAGKQADSDNDLVALLEELAPFIDGRLRAE